MCKDLPGEFNQRHLKTALCHFEHLEQIAREIRHHSKKLTEQRDSFWEETFKLDRGVVD